MKKLHIIFIIAYMAVAAVAVRAVYVESLRDTWIWVLLVFIGVVLSIFSHVKLRNRPSIVRGEVTFLGLATVSILLPVLGIIFAKQMNCQGFDLTCVVIALGVLVVSAIVWVVAIIVGLISVAKSKNRLPNQVV